jgi:hypothetical protein
MTTIGNGFQKNNILLLAKVELNLHSPEYIAMKKGMENIFASVAITCYSPHP